MLFDPAYAIMSLPYEYPIYICIKILAFWLKLVLIYQCGRFFQETDVRTTILFEAMTIYGRRTYNVQQVWGLHPNK